MTLRKLHIKDKIWKYLVGDKFVRIQSPSTKFFSILKSEFKFDKAPSKVLQQEILEWEDEGNPNVQEFDVISPQKIKDYIEKNLISIF